MLEEEDKEVIKEVAIETIETFSDEIVKEPKKDESNNMQLDFSFVEKENLINELSEIEVLELNPLEAMNKLYKLVSEARKLNRG